MRLTTKTAGAAAAIAALAVPAAAVAENQGGTHSRSAEQRSAHQKKTQKVAFVVTGTLTGETVAATDRAAGGETLSLDVTSANRHARQGFDADPRLSRSFIEKTGTEGTKEFTVDSNGASVRLAEGQTDLAAGQQIKLIGKVERTRTRTESGKPTWSYGTPDIRKVVVTDSSDQD